MKNLVVVILCLIGSIIIVRLDNFGKDSIGLLTLLIIDIFIAFITFLIAKDKPKVCKYAFTIILAINFLLFFNAIGWNEGNMQGSHYYVPFLKNVTDVLYALMLFSAFLLMIPIIIYVVFLYSVAQLFCKNKTVKKLDTLAEYFKRKEEQKQ